MKRTGYVETTGASESYAWAATNVDAATSQIDIAVRVAFNDWTAGVIQAIAAQWDTTTGERWLFRMNGSNRLQLYLWDTAARFVTASVALPAWTDGTPHWLRVTWETTGNACTFYTCPSEDGETWVPLAAAQTLTADNIQTGKTSRVTIGARDDSGTFEMLAGRVYALQVRDTIGGSLLVDVNFGDDAWTSGDTTGRDRLGVTWTISDLAYLSASSPYPVDEVDRWTVYARRAVGTGKGLRPPFLRMAQITQWDTFEFRLRFNDIGTWSMSLPYDNPAVKWLTLDGGGITVQYDEQTVFSGNVAQWEHEWSSTDNSLTVSGTTDEDFLAWRMAHMEPTTYAEASPGLEQLTQYSTHAYDVKTGKAEDVLIYYVSYNVGPSALAERRLVGENPQSLSRGNTVTGRARMQPLLEILQELAHAGGDLGFRMYVPGNNASPVFEVYQPRDRSKTTVFSPERGNLVSYKFSTAAPQANFVYLGTSGEGTARYFLLDADDESDSITLWGRRERFVDARDIQGTPPTLSEVQERAVANLAETTEQLSITATILGDLPGSRFPIDWYLGDKVGIYVTEHSQLASEPVRTVVVKLTPTGVEVEAEVGTEGIVGRSLTESQLGPALRKLETRILRVERR